ncbi:MULTISPECIES: SDR family NAD(P)-dependent oxidoreductase [Spiribacter]|uniref:SDR family NAD(P)-dependent oxidoreductase n=1 Tax=Spiribacter aquaticus TaxID=1935996 RepID=A0A557RFC6_9GAMM|nr:MULTISPECIES: SDR family NAD(P)-dependent oxidoreductase [Spiribacter]PZA00514.1 short-chain dehydrogenase [Gammaproteobacteria bacterium 2W06]KAF0280420.1 short-chain dehydrogenase [Spiribacter roseus]KAF0281231.1 short-chain dehydrogenase [Spiribacter roseus]KAF0283455.1 short-chain dehydrogenase [Spiribacter roseus]TVO63847.1 SDR family NAD(P)-dependent oxidoreductase [Spiribacter aquaticus]
MNNVQPVCVINGVGPGNGAAFARRFAAAGYRVALIARSADFCDSLAAEIGDSAHAYQCDIGDPTGVSETFARIREALGPVEVLLHNAGAGIWGDFESLELSAFEQSWRVNTLGLVAAARAVAPDMRRAGHGSIVVTGATASRRGAAKTAAFASAKGAQRNLTESLAKQLWPDGIHVSTIMIDGIVDLPRTRERLPDKPDTFFLDPDDVAETAYWLVQQPRSAWSFEVEARPFGESW